MLDDAISCIDLIAPEGTVAYAEDKNGNRTIIGSSDDESKVELPIVCLVNGNTASAAELFAASLRTMNGARLVGTTTMGKGTIQSSPQRLSDGSAVSITVAKLICGDGSCFDGTGLSVDVERALSAEETTNFYDYTPEDDPQIQRAVSAAQQLSGTTTLGGVTKQLLRLLLPKKPTALPLSRRTLPLRKRLPPPKQKPAVKQHPAQNKG